MERNLEKQFALLVQQVHQLEADIKSLKLTRMIHVSELEALHQEIKSLTNKIEDRIKS